MAKFEMYQQFQNRKSGRIAHVTKVDDTCKTIILMYDESHDGDKENGICLSYPTVSKNWKRLETYSHPDIPSVTNEKPAKKEEKKQVTKKQKVTAEPVEENQKDVASDGTPYAEVMQEILADEKQAVANIKAAKPERTGGRKKREMSNPNKLTPETLDKLLEITHSIVDELGGEWGVPRDENMKFRALRKTVGGKQFCKLMWSGRSIRLFSKVSTSYPHKIATYALPQQYDFIDTDESTISALRELLTKSFNACEDFKSKKEEK